MPCKTSFRTFWLLPLSFPRTDACACAAYQLSNLGNSVRGKCLKWRAWTLLYTHFSSYVIFSYTESTEYGICTVAVSRIPSELFHNTLTLEVKLILRLQSVILCSVCLAFCVWVLNFARTKDCSRSWHRNAPKAQAGTKTNGAPFEGWNFSLLTYRSYLGLLLGPLVWFWRIRDSVSRVSRLSSRSLLINTSKVAAVYRGVLPYGETGSNTSFHVRVAFGHAPRVRTSGESCDFTQRPFGPW